MPPCSYTVTAAWLDQQHKRTISGLTRDDADREARTAAQSMIQTVYATLIRIEPDTAEQAASQLYSVILSWPDREDETIVSGWAHDAALRSAEGFAWGLARTGIAGASRIEPDAAGRPSGRRLPSRWPQVNR